MPFWCYNVFGNANRDHKLFMGDAGSLTLGYVISFLIIAAAIFCVVKAINSVKKTEAPAEEAPAEPSEEVLLLREIRDSLNKK